MKIMMRLWVFITKAEFLGIDGLLTPGAQTYAPLCREANALSHCDKARFGHVTRDVQRVERHLKQLSAPEFM